MWTEIFLKNILTRRQNSVTLRIDMVSEQIRRYLAMKKNIGSKLALYPMPIAVIGAMNGKSQEGKTKA